MPSISGDASDLLNLIVSTCGTKFLFPQHRAMNLKRIHCPLRNAAYVSMPSTSGDASDAYCYPAIHCVQVSMPSISGVGFDQLEARGTSGHFLFQCPQYRAMHLRGSSAITDHDLFGFQCPQHRAMHLTRCRIYQMSTGLGFNALNTGRCI